MLNMKITTNELEKIVANEYKGISLDTIITLSNLPLTNYYRMYVSKLLYFSTEVEKSYIQCENRVTTIYRCRG